MTFSDLNLNKPLLNALEDAGFVYPTAIQREVFSVVMSGRDVVGIAQTGTGKTLAYLLPLLRLWQFTKEKHPQILILVPTRELVVQVEEELNRLKTYMSVRVAGVYGGVNLKQHTALVMEGADVVIATPGRLMDLILNGALKLKQIKRLVIDEVDELLNEGFRAQLTAIFDALPERRQNIMFSATLSEEVEAIVSAVFNDPVLVEATPAGTPVDRVDQSFIRIPNLATKMNLLEILEDTDEALSKVLVFTDSRATADDVYERLEPVFGDQLGVIHSNKSQNSRFATVERFKSGEVRILIATDVIARGIDVSDVSHVINMDVPESAELYVHRIGRTGRADRRGKAITFVADYELEKWNGIAEELDLAISEKAAPERLVISDILLPQERDTPVMPNMTIKNPVKLESQGAFHEKKAKNLKVNMKLSRAEKMRLKYGKPKKRRNN
ncbi:MAG: DEAD/DEAH box helicase [Flavobacteriales bacterium]|jgi:ATP-dependent RNA helicase RhlE